MKPNTVVQFTNNHKWKGCLGIVEEIEPFDDYDERYLICVPIPNNKGYEYTVVRKSQEAVKIIGKAVIDINK